MLQIKSNTPFAAESQGARMGSDQSPLKGETNSFLHTNYVDIGSNF